MRIGCWAQRAIFALTLGATPASAAEVFAGVYAHDVDFGVAACCDEHGADLQVGLRSNPIVSLQGLGDLRVYALGSMNTDGGVDGAAAGVVWRLHLSDTLYLQPALGAAAQSGDADRFQRSPDRLHLGPRLLFAPDVSFGCRFAPAWAIELSYIHLSHARLEGPQTLGLGDLGVRLIYRFAD